MTASTPEFPPAGTDRRPGFGGILAAVITELTSVRSHLVFLAAVTLVIPALSVGIRLALDDEPLTLRDLTVGIDLSFLIAGFAAAAIIGGAYRHHSIAWIWMMDNRRGRVTLLRIGVVLTGALAGLALGLALACGAVLLIGDTLPTDIPDAQLRDFRFGLIKFVTAVVLAALLAVITRSTVLASLIFAADVFVIEAMVYALPVQAFKDVGWVLPFLSGQIANGSSIPGITATPLQGGVALACWVVVLGGLAWWSDTRRAIR
ncbi:hypothetical protein M0E82_02115 [Corynebacterium sp. P7202]|uniref:Uncharacterized protein n=1 Tax=Corynebacterium pygosceleis TaxID=2800406 RepID=A0A9Q4GJW7_9CORY|nr:hypothetical protein [Corynebacterium pygosceleis]MCK7636804.1 hypothetical protein [Corynebacterium pygosceleis]MCX7443970.1 hypothetical protein [Corynebacterium pygosceleis]MCX7467557.1 hypothetical protein [Corynebacterium pygosceleis]